MKTLRLFTVRTMDQTFEADDFDWGDTNEQAGQRISFFLKGNLLHRVLIENVLEIFEPALQVGPK